MVATRLIGVSHFPRQHEDLFDALFAAKYRSPGFAALEAKSLKKANASRVSNVGDAKDSRERCGGEKQLKGFLRRSAREAAALR